jgi:hypothetical protein
VSVLSGPVASRALRAAAGRVVDTVDPIDWLNEHPSPTHLRDREAWMDQVRAAMGPVPGARDPVLAQLCVKRTRRKRPHERRIRLPRQPLRATAAASSNAPSTRRNRAVRVSRLRRRPQPDLRRTVDPHASRHRSRRSLTPVQFPLGNRPFQRPAQTGRPFLLHFRSYRRVAPSSPWGSVAPTIRKTTGMPNIEMLIAVVVLTLAAWMMFVPPMVFIITRNLQWAWRWYVTIIAVAVEVILRLR